MKRLHEPTSPAARGGVRPRLPEQPDPDRQHQGRRGRRDAEARRLCRRPRRRASRRRGSTRRRCGSPRTARSSREPTAFYHREKLPVGERVEGPAVLVQFDSTVVVPPGSERRGAPDRRTFLVRRLDRRRRWQSPKKRPKAPIVDVIEYERGEPTEGKIDPITARVIAGALDNIALEVGHKLTRMAYSSIIRESEDFGVALLDAEGRQICECALSTPLQLGPIPGYVRGIMRLFDERGETFNGATSSCTTRRTTAPRTSPTSAFCVPIFVDGELVGFSVTTAHHLDVGAHGSRVVRHRRRRRRLRRGAAVQGPQGLRPGCQERRRSGA